MLRQILKPPPPESSRVIVHLKILQEARLGGSEL